MQFEDVVGHADLKNHLKKMVDSGRISHALMFTGNEGSGNLAMGLAFANYLLMKDSQDPHACAQKTAKYVHPDLHFCYPVNTTKKVTGPKIYSKDFIEDWRHMIQTNPYMSLANWLANLGIENKQGLINVNQAADILTALQLKPYESSFKLMLIWLPEQMNPETANKLLKILEEPPEKTVFILVSQNPEQLLPTIISRVQIIHVKPIAQDDMVGALMNRFNLPQEEAAKVSRIAQGNFLAAQSLIRDNEEREFFQEMFVQWMRFLWQKEFFSLMQWSETMSKIGRERQMQFFRYGLHIFRESLILNYADSSIQMSGGKEMDFLQKFSPYVNELNALDMVSMFEEAIHHISRNANPQIMIMDISLKMMKLVRKKVS